MRYIICCIDFDGRLNTKEILSASFKHLRLFAYFNFQFVLTQYDKILLFSGEEFLAMNISINKRGSS